VKRESYTLGDLLSESQLGLELLTGGQDALAIPLMGAHAIELENPAKWLDCGWMMLSMGVRLRNKPHMQRKLIADLQELGASCLGFGVGHSFKCVPPALLDEARKRNFPVVLVPEQTQFREVARAVFHSTVGIESTTFQRLSSIQQNLIRAFTDANPLESLVQRLGRLVHSTVAVISLDAHVDAATGKMPTAEIASALDAWSTLPIAQFAVGEWQVLAAPVSASCGPSARWLVVASRGSAVTFELARAAVQITAPLIGALMRLSVANQGQDRAIRQALLDSALDDAPEKLDVRDLAARMSALGVDFRTDARTVVVRERSSALDRRQPSVVTEEVTAWLHSRLEGLGIRYLMSRRPAELVIVVNSDSAFQTLSEELVEQWPALTVGVGRPVASIAAIRTSHRDAQIAVQHLALRTDERVMAFDDLDVVTQLLAEVPMERLAATAAPVAALLAENPIQLEALRAYFAMNRDVKAAADSIFLHPNTLRYRLERLEQALGRSLRDPAVTASLYCVLTLMPDLAPTADAADVSTPESPFGPTADAQPPTALAAG
jgi:purine catabolism regulator